MKRCSESRASSKVRILYVEPSSGLGGSAKSLASLLRRLDTDKTEAIVAMTNRSATTRLFDDVNIPVHRVGPGVEWRGESGFPLAARYLIFGAEFLLRALPLAVRLALLARRSRAMIIHLNTDLSSNLAGVLASALVDVPAISHQRPIRPLRKAELLAARLVRKIVVVSESARGFYSNNYPWLAQKLVLVRDMYELPEVLPEDARKLRRSIGIPDSAFVFGVFSNFSPGKGQDDFIRAAAHLAAELPQARFLLVGGTLPSGDRLREKCVRLGEELGISDRVFFTGWRSDISQLLAACDVVVEPSSLPEGLRRTIIEAALSNKPIIATEVGSAREVLLDGKCGILVPARHPEVLAEQMAALAGDGQRRAALGAGAGERARLLFSPRPIADKLEAIYGELADRF